MKEQGRFENTADPNEFRYTSVSLTEGDRTFVKLVQDRKGALHVKKTLTKYHSPDYLSKFLSEDEYPQVGFIDQGNSVSVRSFQEQAEFTALAAEADLPVKVAVYADDETIIYPYTYGENLRAYVQDGEVAAIRPALDVLYGAHDKDILMGDRWASNWVVQRDTSVVPIDFEVAISGPTAKEFEMAQLMYSVSGATRKPNTTTEIFADFSNTSATEYNWEQVIYYMRGYNEFFKKRPRDFMPRLGEKLNTVARGLKNH